uniref:Protein kinase domain-containing protein n=1 Tax=Alexandrium monilatum TaxID=311494 RepID=A0A7S4Q0K0_9DINO
MGGCIAHAESEEQQPVEEVVMTSYSLSVDTDDFAGHHREFHKHFELKGILYTGRFEQIRLAEQAKTGATVLVRIVDLRSEVSLGVEILDSERLRWANRPSRVLPMLAGSLHCTQLLGTFLDGCFFYRVMESCPRTLQHTLSGLGDVQEHHYISLFRSMFNAVAFMHSKGVVHRNIRPEHIVMAGPDGFEVKLSTFDWAGVRDRAVFPDNWKLRGKVNWPAYMSPEMLWNMVPDFSTDIWSLGTLAYVLLLGDFPYQPKTNPRSKNPEARVTSQSLREAIRHAHPQPTFEPSRRIACKSMARVSSSARMFLKQVLVWEACQRPTAAETLGLEWFQVELTPCEDLSSLKPALEAAKRIGAFRPQRSAEPCKKDIEPILQRCQARDRAVRQTKRADRISLEDTIGSEFKALKMIRRLSSLSSATGSPTGQDADQLGSPSSYDGVPPSGQEH